MVWWVRSCAIYSVRKDSKFVCFSSKQLIQEYQSDSKSPYQEVFDYTINRGRSIKDHRLRLYHALYVSFLLLTFWDVFTTFNIIWLLKSQLKTRIYHVWDTRTYRSWKWNNAIFFSDISHNSPGWGYRLQTPIFRRRECNENSTLRNYRYFSECLLPIIR